MDLEREEAILRVAGRLLDRAALQEEYARRIFQFYRPRVWRAKRVAKLKEMIRELDAKLAAGDA